MISKLPRTVTSVDPVLGPEASAISTIYQVYLGKGTFALEKGPIELRAAPMLVGIDMKMKTPSKPKNMRRIGRTML